jgi:DNA-binding Lrp family transcriptional regulator
MKTIMKLGDRASELLLDSLNQRIVRELVFSGYSIAELSRRLNIPPLKIWRRIQKLAGRASSRLHGSR